MADTKEAKRQPVQRSRWSKLKSWAFGGVGKRNQQELIEQYYVSLRATFERICERPRERDLHKDLIAQIKDLLSAEYTWSSPASPARDGARQRRGRLSAGPFRKRRGEAGEDVVFGHLCFDERYGT